MFTTKVILLVDTSRDSSGTLSVALEEVIIILLLVVATALGRHFAMQMNMRLTFILR